MIYVWFREFASALKSPLISILSKMSEKLEFLSRTEAADISGVDVDEKYILTDLSRVYSGIHEDTNKKAIVKIPISQHPNHRFFREVAFVKNFKHPAMAKYISHGKAEVTLGRTVHYLVEEDARGQELFDLIYHKELSWQDAVDITTQMADFLGCLHKHKRTLRDLKPSSVIITDNNEVRFIDFATIARYPHKNKGWTFGTPPFLSVDEATSYLDHRSEIYVLGLILFNMTQGYVPFHEASRYGANFNINIFLEHHNNRPRPRYDLSKAPIELERINHKMLAIHRIHRYQSMEEVIDDLRKL
jgi:serine/threonine protein kinase